MFKCHVCGNKTDRTDLVSEVFDIEGRRVLVERIPAQVCARCGEAVFSPEIVEKIRRLIHSESHPIKTVPMDVFALV